MIKLFLSCMLTSMSLTLTWPALGGEGGQLLLKNQRSIGLESRRQLLAALIMLGLA
jgi:hypothetical protein